MLKSPLFALFQLFIKSLKTLYLSGFPRLFRPFIKLQKVIPPGFDKWVKVGELGEEWGNGFVILFCSGWGYFLIKFKFMYASV